MGKNLVILGAGGFAREVAWLVADINRAGGSTVWNIVGFVEHTPERMGQDLGGIPIITLEQAARYLPDLHAVAAIGASTFRERAVREAERLGFNFATLIHPTVRMDFHTVRIGEGSMICAGNILTVDITIGKHVLLNLDCTVGHNCVLEDYVSVAPGCHLSGYTTLRRGCRLGTGATTIERTEVGESSIVGAGAVVVRDIPPHVTAVGVPARVREQSER